MSPVGARRGRPRVLVDVENDGAGCARFVVKVRSAYVRFTPSLPLLPIYAPKRPRGYHLSYLQVQSMVITLATSEVGHLPPR